MKYLGSVAVQGGLPLRLLEHSHKGIGLVIGRVIRIARNSNPSFSDFESWVESLSNYLPQSYRQKEVLALIADIAWVALRLKVQAELSDPDSVIADLDGRLPNWRDRFPLLIDNATASSLIEKVMRDVASAPRNQNQANLIAVTRSLLDMGEGRWNVQSEVVLPVTLSVSALRAICDVPENVELPRALTLAVHSGQTKFQTDIRLLANSPCYRAAPHRWTWDGQEACGEHLISIAAADGRSWWRVCEGGEALDDLLPWVFSLDDAGYRLLQQGAGDIAEVSGLVACHTSAKVQNQAGNNLNPIGAVTSPSLNIYNSSEDISVLSDDAEVLMLRFGRAGADRLEYSWSGRRVWLEWLSPKEAFIGSPTVYEVDAEGGRRPIKAVATVKVIGAGGAQPTIGPVFATVAPHGAVRRRTRMVILPDEAYIDFLPVDTRTGKIVFKSWGLSGVNATDQEVTISQEIVAADLVVTMVLPENYRGLEGVRVELCWPHTTTTASVTLPVPVQGIEIVDSAGHLIPDRASVSLKRLHGARVTIYRGHQNTNGQVLINGNGINARHIVLGNPGAHHIRLGLTDVAQEVSRILSISDDIDAAATVTIETTDGRSHSLRVCRVDAQLSSVGDTEEVVASTGYLTHLEPSDIQVYASNLSASDIDACELNARMSEGVQVWAWEFAANATEPGAWLVYPGPSSPVLFRPKIRYVHGEFNCESPLSEAMSLSSPERRECALDGLIAEMVDDYSHRSWVEVRRLVAAFGHLPLSTIDLWRRAVKSPDLMAALVFRIGDLPNEFISRFAAELPFSWEAVPLSSWTRAAEMSCGQMVPNIQDEKARETWGRLIQEQAIQFLSAQCPSIAFTLGIVMAKYQKSAKAQAEALASHVGPTAMEDLQRPNGPLMSVLRTHAEDQWPVFGAGLVQHARQDSSISRFMLEESYGFHDAMLNGPMVFAVRAVLMKDWEWTSSHEAVCLSRTLSAFDTTWYEAAYSAVIAKAYSEGLLGEHPQ